MTEEYDEQQGQGNQMELQGEEGLKAFMPQRIIS